MTINVEICRILVTCNTRSLCKHEKVFFLILNVLFAINLQCPLPLSRSAKLQLPTVITPSFYRFTVPSLVVNVSGFCLCRLFSSSRCSGGSWTGKTGGSWHCGHHLFPCSGHPLQYNGCLLCQ